MRSNNTTSNRYGQTINTFDEFISDFQSRVEELLSRKNGVWSGTMTQLGYALTRGIKRGRGALPSSPSVMRRVVNTAATRLISRGINVHFDRKSDRSRTRVVSLSSKRSA